MNAQLKELLPFLRDKNPQVRQISLENLLPQTAKDAPHRDIFFSSSQGGGLKKAEDNPVIRDLKLLCRDQLAVAHDAFKALINLSDSPSAVTSLSEVSFLTFLVSYIINAQSILADLASMLLSNLSASATPCSVLISLKIKIIASSKVPNGVYATESRCGSCPTPVPYPQVDEIQVLALPLLLDAFVQGASVEDIADRDKRPRKGSLHFLASVFANLASSSGGRDFFSTPRPSISTFNASGSNDDLEYPIAKILSLTEHKDIIRRGGVVSTIKNFCFNPRVHRALLSPSSIPVSIPVPRTSNSAAATPVVAPGADALPSLLLPLAGPEELPLEIQDDLPDALQLLPPTKTREPDSTIRLTLIEILLLLCHTRWGRDFLRNNGTYEIVRVMHEVEKVEKISEHIERLVQLLQGEEPSEAPDEEEEYDAMPEDDLPPETRLIQGLGSMRIDNGEEEEDEVVIEPLGHVAESEPDGDDDDDDDKIIEV